MATHRAHTRWGFVVAAAANIWLACRLTCIGGGQAGGAARHRPAQPSASEGCMLAYLAPLCSRPPCRYALTGKEVTSIVMQRLIKVDGKVRARLELERG